MTMSQSKIYQSNLCTIIIIYIGNKTRINKKQENSCITYYEPCLNEVFTSAMWSLAHTVFFMYEALWKWSLLPMSEHILFTPELLHAPPYNIVWARSEYRPASIIRIPIKYISLQLHTTTCPIFHKPSGLLLAYTMPSHTTCSTCALLCSPAHSGGDHLYIPFFCLHFF